MNRMSACSSADRHSVNMFGSIQIDSVIMCPCRKTECPHVPLEIDKAPICSFAHRQSVSMFLYKQTKRQHIPLQIDSAITCLYR